MCLCFGCGGVGGVGGMGGVGVFVLQIERIIVFCNTRRVRPVTLQLSSLLGELRVLGCYTYVVCVYEDTLNVMNWFIICVDVDHNRGYHTTLEQDIIGFLRLLRSLFSYTYNLLLDSIFWYTLHSALLPSSIVQECPCLKPAYSMIRCRSVKGAIIFWDA